MNEIIGALPPDWNPSVIDTIKSQGVLKRFMGGEMTKTQQQVQYRIALNFTREKAVQEVLRGQFGLTVQEARFCELILHNHINVVGAGMPREAFVKVLEKEKDTAAKDPNPEEIQEFREALDSILTKIQR